jgi:uncharacterized Zn finger protein (UPF0148 family)
MKLIKLNCSACGAPISIPDNLENLTCANCGTFLTVEHGEGYYALKAADQISNAIHESGRGTQEVIQQTAEETRKELQRLQLNQAYNAAENALHATMAEQRSLTRGEMTPAGLQQLNALNFQEWTQWEDIRRIQMQMDVLQCGPIEENDLALTNQMDMVDHSILIMRTCEASPANQGLIESLQEEKALYQEYYLELQSKEQREKIVSFTIEKPFGEDLNQLKDQLIQFQADLRQLNQQPPSTVTAKLKSELMTRQNELYQHYHQEVYRQCWGERSPNSNPGQDPNQVAKHLEATRATIAWLSQVPDPQRPLQKEIKSLKRQERKLAKVHGSAQEVIRVQNAAKALTAGLAALAITAPFSQNLDEVRGQMKIYNRDIANLKNQPSTPEVRLARQQLNDQYKDFYSHWAELEKAEITQQLKSGHVQPPFTPDLAQAVADYDLVTQDVALLKEQQSIPGVQALYQQAVTKQRNLYNHLLKLKQQNG